MKIAATVGLLCLMTTAAHAGEPWPKNICHTLTGYEERDIKRYMDDPVQLAFARNNVLHMLRVHCGVDTTAKLAGDVAATRQGDSGGGGWEPGQIIEFSKPPTMHCTTMSLGGGMSSTDCE
jgi:hypothetical protein